MEEFYNKHYKVVLVLPILMILASVLIIFNQYQNTGDIVNKDVSLKGGLSAEIYSEKLIEKSDLENKLRIKFADGEFFIRELSELATEQKNGIIIESSNIKEKELRKALEEILEIKLEDEKNYFARETSPILGERFYKQMILTILLAFLLMTVTVIIIYRKIIPSIAIISSPIIDITVTIAAINLLGFRVTDATIAALLLMIGYGIDTDILLTTKVLKRKEGTVYNRIKGSFFTGFTMTLTTIVALTLGTIVVKSFLLKEMFIVLIIGLSTDIIATYVWNASLLRWYLKDED